jgi:hypothetical protein
VQSVACQSCCYIHEYKQILNCIIICAKAYVLRTLVYAYETIWCVCVCACASTLYNAEERNNRHCKTHKLIYVTAYQLLKPRVCVRVCVCRTLSLLCSVIRHDSIHKAFIETHFRNAFYVSFHYCLLFCLF